MVTIRSIYHNIEESKFYTIINDYTLYFSSEFNQLRFESRYDEYFSRVNARFNRVYKLNYEPIIVLSLYKYVEKRGFRVYYKDRRLYDNSIRIEV